MLFRRIAIRNFRKHLSPVVIDELGEGVTVIAGDNEEGKSTLLDAIRTGLFERQNLGGKAADTMQPFGSTVRPEVRIDFEVDGSLYSITKGFIQRHPAPDDASRYIRRCCGRRTARRTSYVPAIAAWDQAG